MNHHCWTGVFAAELPFLSLWGPECIFSLCSVSLTHAVILFLPSLLTIFVISSVLPSVQGSNFPFPVFLDTAPCQYFTLLLQKSFLSYTFIHTYTWKNATHLLRRKFHKGLIISLFSVSHQWIRTPFICFEGQKAVGKGQFEFMPCRFKHLSTWPSFKIIRVCWDIL